MAATDNYKSNSIGLDSPPRKAFAVTTHDTNELSNVSRGLWIGGAGDVTVILADDSAAVTLSAVPAGTLLPLQAKIVKATATTATLIIALY
jgi:hypothetical protein